MTSPTILPRTVCHSHGGRLVRGGGSFCQTDAVLVEVANERADQFERYGDNADLEDGTGPTEHWLRVGDPYLPERDAVRIEAAFRRNYESRDTPTWMHLVREEVAEAFSENDPDRLRSELLQVAALCVSWIEKIDARTEETHDA